MQHMIARYDIRPHGVGRWMVFDTMTGSPAVANGVWLTDLSFEDADDLADALSQLHGKDDNRQARAWALAMFS
jgi:hypothetical protein